MDKIINFLEFYVFINENKLGKMNFPLGKFWNFETIGNSVQITEYLAFRKALLTRLYQKVKVYITNLLSVYVYIIYKKFHALNEIILFRVFIDFWGLLWPWKLTFSKNWMNFLSNFVF